LGMWDNFIHVEQSLREKGKKEMIITLNKNKIGGAMESKATCHGSGSLEKERKETWHLFLPHPLL